MDKKVLGSAAEPVVKSVITEQSQIAAEPVLKACGLTKVFSRRGLPEVVAADQISFELMPGECLGIIGESGSGKSTVVNMIARLLVRSFWRVKISPIQKEMNCDGFTAKCKWFSRRLRNLLTRGGRWETASGRACETAACRRLQLYSG